TKFGMRLDGRSFEIQSDVQQYNATIFNPAGLQIGTLRKDESFTFASAGIYLVHLETAEGTFTKKIAVF
ncbi:MAG: T9SS type A sorting domain-containing protein, partial [Dysgonomonas sp.]